MFKGLHETEWIARDLSRNVNLTFFTFYSWIFIQRHPIDLFCNMQCVFELLKSEFMENLFSDYGRLKFFALPLWKVRKERKLSFKVSNVNSMFEILFCSDWWPICRSLGEKRSRRRWSLCQKSPRWRPRWTITQIQNLWVFPVNCDGKAVFIVFTGSVQLPAPNASDWGSQWHDGGISIHLSSHLLLMVKKTPTISKVDPQRQWRQTP